MSTPTSLSPEVKLQNAQTRLSEIESEIADLQTRHDEALAESLDRVKKAATGECAYSGDEMDQDRQVRDRLMAGIGELKQQRDAVQNLLPDLERDHAVVLAQQARQRQSESADRANELAAQFYDELVTAMETWRRLCMAHDANRRESDQIFDRTEEVGGHIELPPATKFDHQIKDLQRMAAEGFVYHEMTAQEWAKIPI